jgi:hypothetical protein
VLQQLLTWGVQIRKKLPWWFNAKKISDEGDAQAYPSMHR